MKLSLCSFQLRSVLPQWPVMTGSPWKSLFIYFIFFSILNPALFAVLFFKEVMLLSSTVFTCTEQEGGNKKEGRNRHSACFSADAASSQASFIATNTQLQLSTSNMQLSRGSGSTPALAHGCAATYTHTSESPQAACQFQGAHTSIEA